MATGQEILHLKLMSYKNKGKTYVRAYRNKWIAPIPEEAALGKKGRSVPAVQIQVGVIQPSGMVKMSSKFLSLHPEFAQQDWYYLEFPRRFRYYVQNSLPAIRSISLCCR